MQTDPKGLVQIDIVDGILHLNLHKGRIGLEEAKSIISFRLSITKGKAYPFVITNSSVFSIDRKAFQYFSKEGAEGVLANAIIVNNDITKLLVSIYQIFHQSNADHLPLKYFKKKDDAIKWASQFKSPKQQPIT